MTPEEAHAEAVRRIRATAESGRWWLDLGDLPIERVPDEIAELDGLLAALSLGFRELAVVGGELSATWVGVRPGTVRDIGPLRRLASLRWLALSWCSQLESAEPLSRLTDLTTLCLYGCPLPVRAEPLLNLKQLRFLNLSACADLTALRLGDMPHLETLILAQCPRLTALRLDAAPALASLDLFMCPELREINLPRLPALHRLNVAFTGLPTLEPLRPLTGLRQLLLSGCRAEAFEPVRGLLTGLTDLRAFDTRFADLHPAVCGEAVVDNVADAVRAYFAALGPDAGPDAQPDAEIKVFVLGNGRCGKTKLIGRLTGRRFEDIPDGTTHGVAVAAWDVPYREWGLPHPVRLCFWDFGGQDIYHGAHALFVREPAIYLLLYADATENDDRFEDGGFALQNRRLPYWFDFLRQEAGASGIVHGPVLFVQGRCDESGEADAPPFLPPREPFPNLSPLVHASAKDEDGLDHLLPRLKKAVKELLREHPQPPLPANWATVRERIREMQAAGGPRTLTLADLAALCEECGCGADAVHLRDALARMGVVFYRAGVFGDRLVVDQGWVLAAVYALFRRDHALQRQIDARKGRFARDDLERLIWPEHPPADRQSFLDFMEQCGICFPTAPGAYVVPDKLDPWGVDHERQFRRQLADDSGVEATATFALLHDGIARGLLSRIGTVAGEKATYWRYGCHFFDRRTTAEGLVRVEGNAVRVRAWGDRAADLAGAVLDILRVVPCGRLPDIEWAEAADRPTIVEGQSADGERLTPAVLPKSVFFSYRHPHPAVPGSDRGRMLLRELRELLLADGWTVRFDERELQDGDSISGFIEQVRATTFFVPVFCDRYLDSRYTLSELFAFREALAHDRPGFADRAVPVCFPESGLHDDLRQAEAARRGRAKFADYFRAAADGALAPQVYEEVYRLRAWSERLGEVLADLIDRLNTPTARAVADRLNAAHARLYPRRPAVRN